jgi:hypothetical protein
VHATLQEKDTPHQTRWKPHSRLRFGNRTAFDHPIILRSGCSGSNPPPLSLRSCCFNLRLASRPRLFPLSILQPRHSNLFCSPLSKAEPKAPPTTSSRQADLSTKPAQSSQSNHNKLLRAQARASPPPSTHGPSTHPPSTTPRARSPMEVAAVVKTDTQHLNRRNLKRPAPQKRGASSQRKVIKREREYTWFHLFMSNRPAWARKGRSAAEAISRICSSQ